MHHQHGRRRAAAAAASRRSDGDGARASAASSSRCSRASLADSDARSSTPRARAREHAVAPTSRSFKVGAALETADGAIITGCNIENATYGLTSAPSASRCSRRCPKATARFRRIAVVADTDAPTPPCGACRQILWEFGGDLEVVLANLTRDDGAHRLTRPAAAAVRRAPAVVVDAPTPTRQLTDLPSRRPDQLYNRSAMLPTIAWQDDAVVMVDQRKLPAQGNLRPLQDRERGRQGDQDHGDPRRAGDRRRGGDGPRARHAQRSKATGTRQFADRVPASRAT